MILPATHSLGRVARVDCDACRRAAITGLVGYWVPEMLTVIMSVDGRIFDRQRQSSPGGECGALVAAVRRESLLEVTA